MKIKKADRLAALMVLWETLRNENFKKPFHPDSEDKKLLVVVQKALQPLLNLSAEETENYNFQTEYNDTKNAFVDFYDYVLVAFRKLNELGEKDMRDEVVKDVKYYLGEIQKKDPTK